MTRLLPGVTFLLPVHNAGRWLHDVIAGINLQRNGQPFEIIAVDDGSQDGSRALLEQYHAAGAVRLVDGPQRGAAAAINTGLRLAAYPFIAQVDQDVILRPGWLAALVRELECSDIAAAQGHYVTAADAGFWATMTGTDLEHRYQHICGRFVDHVCTGNTLYRASALHQIGLLDETLGYGYDNDLSYRLVEAGYRLTFNRDAISVHRWREGAVGYFRQQFGVGYGRIDVLDRHRTRVRGDDVSGAVMMLHGPLMLVAMALFLVASAAAVIGLPAAPILISAILVISLLFFERTISGLDACIRLKDVRTLGFAPAHMGRDLAWAAAILLWSARRVSKRPSHPRHSMPRRAEIGPRCRTHHATKEIRSVLAVVPAFNEVQTLPGVIHDLRRTLPAADVLVVNDGSTDGTTEMLAALGVRWLRLSQRIGVGSAMRAGLRYAVANGYDAVVRIDGDGQHRACDAGALLAAVSDGNLDAAVGSRFLGGHGGSLTIRRVSQTLLARYMTCVTNCRITDPTSGYWAFGPRAVQLLAQHHPTGYAEPELILFLCRNGLEIGEIPIRMRARLAGRTSLTPIRAAVAFTRTMLALMMVPARPMVDP